MTARFSLLGVIAVLGACAGQEDNTLSLQEIAANPQKWDGKVVTVDGWLLQCRDLDCHILPTAEDLDLIGKGCPGEKCDLAIERFDERAVSMGGDDNFDRAAKPLEGKHVLVTATVNAAQWHNCIDRCGALQPTSIVPYPD